MTTDQTQQLRRHPSIGIDAPSLEPYSELRTTDGEIIIYEEDSSEAWIQCSLWIQTESMS